MPRFFKKSKYLDRLDSIQANTVDGVNQLRDAGRSASPVALEDLGRNSLSIDRHTCTGTVTLNSPITTIRYIAIYNRTRIAIR